MFRVSHLMRGVELKCAC